MNIESITNKLTGGSHPDIGKPTLVCKSTVITELYLITYPEPHFDIDNLRGPRNSDLPTWRLFRKKYPASTGPDAFITTAVP